MLTILGSMGAVLLIVLIVILCTYDGRKPSGQAQTDVSVNAVTQTQANLNATSPLEGNLIGDNPKAFMNDPTFFDPEHSAAFDAAMDQSGNLSIMVTSVEKDLRVLVLDINGELVTGVPFNIKVRDSDDITVSYRDLDKDGIIYAGTIDPGDYDVFLDPVEGYRVPLHSTRVSV